MRYEYHGSFFGDLNQIAHLTKYLLHSLENIDYDKSRLFDVRLILSELLINGYEHGNRKNRNKRIFLTLRVDNERLKVTVEDEGEGMNQPMCNPFNMDCCSGRGLLLVEQLADQLNIDQNRVTAILENQK